MPIVIQLLDRKLFDKSLGSFTEIYKKQKIKKQKLVNVRRLFDLKIIHTMVEVRTTSIVV